MVGTAKGEETGAGGINEEELLEGIEIAEVGKLATGVADEAEERRPLWATGSGEIPRDDDDAGVGCGVAGLFRLRAGEARTAYNS